MRRSASGPADRSVFAWRDLMSEALGGLSGRPGRTALTALGTVIGVAALVATFGLAHTTGNRIVSRFDAIAGTHVSVEPAGFGFTVGGVQRPSPIPWDSQDRLERLNGVVAAGTISELYVDGLVRAVPVDDPADTNEFALPVMAGSQGLLGAVRGEIRTGRFFDRVHDERASSVAVLGPGAAQRLGVSRVDNQPAIFIGDLALVVVGIIENVEREARLLNAVIVPDGLARERYGLAAPAEVHIDTELGAAQLIGSQAAIALSPNDPEALRVTVPPDPASLRSRVGEDVNALLLLLGGLSLVVGSLGIANITLVSILERTSEIGLRRALGSTRRHIAELFLTESAVLGLIAGVVGTSAGVITVVIVSAVQGWEPVLQPWLPLVAPLAGLMIGLVSGAYPAWRAASIEPIAALRSGNQ